jgi:hypothetical protein
MCKSEVPTYDTYIRCSIPLLVLAPWGMTLAAKKKEREVVLIGREIASFVHVFVISQFVRCPPRAPAAHASEVTVGAPGGLESVQLKALVSQRPLAAKHLLNYANNVKLVNWLAHAGRGEPGMGEAGGHGGHPGPCSQLVFRPAVRYPYHAPGGCMANLFTFTTFDIDPPASSRRFPSMKAHRDAITRTCSPLSLRAHRSEAAAPPR